MRAAVLLLAVVMTSLPGLASERNIGPPHPQAVLSIVMDFQENEYSALVLAAMKRELEYILSPLELHVDWYFHQEALGQEFFGHLAVVRFKGKCRVEETAKHDFKTRALGMTHVSEGQVLPYAEVHCERVREKIQPAVLAESFLNREMLLGRALGRVLAHELYHILTQVTDHAEYGLAKALITPRELVYGSLELEEPARELLREKLNLPVDTQ